jgi:AcrR family transcriptional regulator
LASSPDNTTRKRTARVRTGLRRGEPRHSARATRTTGRSMRSHLLDAATALFKAHGLNGTSITAIAGATDAFPSQVTYYFRTKEALFVEAACRDVLYLAERTEHVVSQARSPRTYVDAIIDNVMGADGLMLFVEALTLARQRPDLMPEIARTIDRLHVEAARAYTGKIARHGWRTYHAPDVTARRFWTIALGAALEGHALGWSTAAMCKAAREAMGELAEARAAGAKRAPSLHLVTGRSS